jgi:hypothetical protein
MLETIQEESESESKYHYLPKNPPVKKRGFASPEEINIYLEKCRLADLLREAKQYQDQTKEAAAEKIAHKIAHKIQQQELELRIASVKRALEAARLIHKKRLTLAEKKVNTSPEKATQAKKLEQLEQLEQAYGNLVQKVKLAEECEQRYTTLVNKQHLGKAYLVKKINVKLKQGVRKAEQEVRTIERDIRSREKSERHQRQKSVVQRLQKSLNRKNIRSR